MTVTSKDFSGYANEDVKKQNTQASEVENIKIDEKQVTFINYTHRYCVCVIDIVDSTKTTSRINGSEKIRDFYSIFLNTMASIIKTHNGKVIKNAGDCLIYYFPKTVDGSNESAFKDVIDCGVAMIDANTTINSRLNENHLPPIRYRISGNYGIMELAMSLNSNNVDLFGPTLNICSKINHLAPPNGMVIYKDLYDVLSENLEDEEYLFKEIQCNNDDDDDDDDEMSIANIQIWCIWCTALKSQQKAKMSAATAEHKNTKPSSNNSYCNNIKNHTNVNKKMN